MFLSQNYSHNFFVIISTILLSSISLTKPDCYPTSYHTVRITIIPTVNIYYDSYYEFEEESRKILQGYDSGNPQNLDIFEPTPENFPLDSLFDLLKSDVEEETQPYEQHPDSTPQSWFIRDQRNWIDAGIPYIPYDKSWWKLFTTYDGIFVDFWGSYYYLLPDRDNWSVSTDWSPITTIYSPKRDT